MSVTYLGYACVYDEAANSIFKAACSWQQSSSIVECLDHVKLKAPHQAFLHTLESRWTESIEVDYLTSVMKRTTYLWQLNFQCEKKN